MYPETDTKQGADARYGGKNQSMPTVAADTLAVINSQTSEALAQCVELAKSLNDRLSGPRPEAVGRDVERPFDGNALAAARVLRDFAQELQGHLHRAHQAL